MTAQTHTDGEVQVFLLDDDPLPIALQDLAQTAGKTLDVSQGRAALSGQKDSIVVMRGPVLDIAQALASGATGPEALSTWVDRTTEDLNAVVARAETALIMDRWALACDPEAALGPVRAAWGMDGSSALPRQDGGPKPPALVQVLAAALVAGSPEALALARQCGAALSLGLETALQACRDVTALHTEAVDARAEAIVARAGQDAAQRHAETVRRNAARREEILGAALLRAPEST